MMATPTKAQILNELLGLLDVEFQRLAERSDTGEAMLPDSTPGGRMPVLDAMLLGICRENAGHLAAIKALRRLKTDFFDFNEVRVSRVKDLLDVLDLPDAETRARTILRLLKQVFNHIVKTGDKARLEVVLDVLARKPQKEALKALERFEAFTQSDHVQATVIQSALGGHALPLDAVTRGLLERLEVLDPGLDPAAARSQLERLVPKARGVEFLMRLELLAGRLPGVELDVEQLRLEVRRRLGLPESAAQSSSSAGSSEREAGTSSAPAAKPSGSRSARGRSKASASSVSNTTAPATTASETATDPLVSTNHQIRDETSQASETIAPTPSSVSSQSVQHPNREQPGGETVVEPRHENGPPPLRKSQNAKRSNPNAPTEPPFTNGSPPPRSKRSRKS
ncbi:hypothetical protein Isop_1535 [Isosphaera pallida ATCC 43644]|uniref:Uncharacterized protein n=1 Tax=Isosphaera pallida (strain ATCC 43644 / DSM 9630 / IS1B) TaxID=575540 RepID=E8QYY3_ISOPI|nr:hypothetical protein [Isosphaera pallida]ADV62120.1 hypothetical protein Isop_1535 [Isosphaera pallida ATCC 43644]